MAGRIVIRVDDRQVQALLDRAEDGLDRLVEEVAQELSERVQAEGAKRSQRLGAEWAVNGTGDAEREVEAPEWWAHFVTGGTRPHGASTGSRMVFAVDGKVVSASFVQGVSADPFDEAAIRDTESRVDDIIRRLIEGGL